MCHVVVLITPIPPLLVLVGLSPFETQHICPLMRCTMSILAHVYSYMLYHAELELKEPTEQAQAEDLANLALDQGKPRCIQPVLLVFYFESLLYILSFLLCIKSIGTVWHHSCILFILPELSLTTHLVVVTCLQMLGVVVRFHRDRMAWRPLG
jgi:hypothetical protein